MLFFNLQLNCVCLMITGYLVNHTNGHVFENYATNLQHRSLVDSGSS